MNEFKNYDEYLYLDRCIEYFQIRADYLILITDALTNPE